MIELDSESESVLLIKYVNTYKESDSVLTRTAKLSKGKREHLNLKLCTGINASVYIYKKVLFTKLMYMYINAGHSILKSQQNPP